jgi:protoporphyrinogen oxidase
MGYGMLERTPILHVFRWVTPTLLISGVMNILWEVEHFQTLFERMAERLDVRYRCEVGAITRAADGTFAVTTPDGVLTFDRLVVACYLDDMPADLLAISPEISAVIPELRYKRWVVSLCRITRADGQPFYEDRVVACPDAWEPAYEGEVLAIKKDIFAERSTSPQDDQYVCYQFYNDAAAYTPEQSEAQLERDLLARGGVVHEVLDRFTTRYAPTYSAGSIQGGLLARLARLQGARGVYYTGATFSHEAVRDIANFNRSLADQIVFDLDGRRKPALYRARQLLGRIHPYNL